MRQENSTGKQLDDLLNTQSGLLGISGISADMRQIIASMKSGNTRAKLAYEMFVHHLQSSIGAMIAVLGGIDALVFTAGIGENSSELRDAACANFAFLGLKLDSAKNIPYSVDQDISRPESTVRVLLIRAQEDWAIARDCWRLATAKSAGPGAS
jgi:acetate kinase